MNEQNINSNISTNNNITPPRKNSFIVVIGGLLLLLGSLIVIYNVLTGNLLFTETKKTTESTTTKENTPTRDTTTTSSNTKTSKSTTNSSSTTTSTSKPTTSTTKKTTTTKTTTTTTKKTTTKAPAIKAYEVYNTKFIPLKSKKKGEYIYGDKDFEIIYSNFDETMVNDGPEFDEDEKAYSIAIAASNIKKFTIRGKDVTKTVYNKEFSAIDVTKMPYIMIIHWNTVFAGGVVPKHIQIYNYKGEELYRTVTNNLLTDRKSNPFTSSFIKYSYDPKKEIVNITYKDDIYDDAWYPLSEYDLSEIDEMLSSAGGKSYIQQFMTKTACQKLAKSKLKNEYVVTLQFSQDKLIKKSEKTISYLNSYSPIKKLCKGLYNITIK